jgi:hypothetical protein
MFRVGGKMRIYLDNCCYNRPFDDQEQMNIQLETIAKLYIQRQIREGVYDLVWSYMLDYENGNNPYLEKQISIGKWKHVAVYHCRSTPEILHCGQGIAAAGIKIADALHLACALSGDCRYFITTDSPLLKKKCAGIEVINPIDFVRTAEKTQ